MTQIPEPDETSQLLRRISAEQPVLIAGPTASGKSDLALAIAETQGGVIVNADASQVYECWRIITARPDARDEARAPHALYGHVAEDAAYSTGHWLREVAPLLDPAAGHPRPIIVGGTGLYFNVLTRGLAQIPPTDPAIRQAADALPLAAMLAALDPQTLAQIDQRNRARVQRAYEVLQATGRGLASWQAETPPPLLPLARAFPVVFDVSPDWLNARIARRFDAMLEQGALEEIAAVAPRYDPALPAHRAIGAPELMAHHRDGLPLAEAREAAIIATRQFAKRQRTWMRSKMGDWHPVTRR